MLHQNGHHLTQDHLGFLFIWVLEFCIVHLSLVHYELILMKCVSSASKLFVLHVDVQLLQQYLLNKLSFIYFFVFAFFFLVKEQYSIFMCLFLNFLFCAIELLVHSFANNYIVLI